MRSEENAPVERILVDIKQTSDRAYLVVYFDVTTWIAKSQIQTMTMNAEGTKAEMVIPKWIFDSNFSSVDGKSENSPKQISKNTVSNESTCPSCGSVLVLAVKQS